MVHLNFLATTAITALLFALVEIQIEGPAGWASSLPTWRIENRLTSLLLGRRALTGYHLYIHLFVLLLIHLPFLLGFAVLSLAVEARIFAFLILFWILEDFLWFVLNRDYGVRHFTREHAWWHAHSWWWIMPREYWIFTPIGLVLYLWSLP